MSADNSKKMSEEDLNKRGRIKFTLVTLLFIAPMLAAWALFFGVQSGGLWGTSNKGELLVPAIPLQDFALNLQDEALFTLKEMEIKWTLVYFSDGTCEPACQQTIYHLRQIRTALSKDMMRVERLLVLANEPSTELRQFLMAYPDMKVVKPNEAANNFRLQFPDITDANLSQTIFLVDPMGNIMMRYSITQEPEDILKDLRKLLRISRIG